MCIHLATVGATYYFRMAVPAELRPFLLTKAGKPRTEFMESLGTKDRDTAKRLLPDRVKLAHRLASLSSSPARRPRPRQRQLASRPATAVAWFRPRLRPDGCETSLAGSCLRGRGSRRTKPRAELFWDGGVSRALSLAPLGH
jgi:hypothetical protein